MKRKIFKGEDKESKNTKELYFLSCFSTPQRERSNYTARTPML